MADTPTPDYMAMNKARREAVEAERRFLKKEVMGQGSEIPTSYENIQSDMEKAIEQTDNEENT